MTENELLRREQELYEALKELAQQENTLFERIKAEAVERAKEDAARLAKKELEDRHNALDAVETKLWDRYHALNKEEMSLAQRECKVNHYKQEAHGAAQNSAAWRKRYEEQCRRVNHAKKLLEGNPPNIGHALKLLRREIEAENPLEAQERLRLENRILEPDELQYIFKEVGVRNDQIIKDSILAFFEMRAFLGGGSYPRNWTKPWLTLARGTLAPIFKQCPFMANLRDQAQTRAANLGISVPTKTVPTIEAEKGKKAAKPQNKPEPTNAVCVDQAEERENKVKFAPLLSPAMFDCNMRKSGIQDQVIIDCSRTMYFELQAFLKGKNARTSWSKDWLFLAEHGLSHVINRNPFLADLCAQTKTKMGIKTPPAPKGKRYIVNTYGLVEVQED